MPNDKPDADADDKPSPDSANDVQAVPTSEPENDTTPPPAAAAMPARKKVDVLPGAPLGEAYDAVIAELASVPGLYCQDGSLVTVDPASAKVWKVDHHQLTELVTQVCEIWSVSGAKLRPVTVPPQWLLKGILRRRDFPGVRVLREVLHHPMILPDGSVMIEPGYRDGLVLVKHGLDLQITDQPTRADAKQAVEFIKDVVCDFPFARSVHLSAWISMLLSAVTSAAHSGNIPLTVMDANKKGTGKTRLVHIVSLMMSGRQATPKTWRDGDQMRKLISTEGR